MPVKFFKTFFFLLAPSVFGCQDVRESRVDLPSFNREIAPIIFEHCAACHRPGESAPFALTNYAEVRDHAAQITEVTQSRYMPPWLPDDCGHPLEGERRLTPKQIKLISEWVDAGTPAGNRADLPRLPTWTPGWQLGEPDLVVEMPVPYKLPSGGRDVYRNFVIPIPLETPKYVRAMEFRPADPNLVHHAFLMVNRDGESRRTDELDSEPGFDGMEAVGADAPDGHFISWQPGKMPTFSPEGTSWLLVPGTDLVLQMHMQPTGKPEQVRAKVGFFFTDEPPTRFPFKIVLRRTDIDIPAGEANYVIEDSFTLPVDVELMAVIPHAHYLGKTLEAIAVSPDGKEETLLRIPDWDFNWQGDYRFRQPVKLPRGTRLVQRFSYDNTATNPRNPHAPPHRVAYGLQSVDEMGELWLQLMPNSIKDRRQLGRAFGEKVLHNVRRLGVQKLKQNPEDIKALIDVGKVTLALESPAKAIEFFQRAIAANPDSAAAHYYLGHAAMLAENPQQARRELMLALKLDNQHFMAKHDLGLLAMRLERLDFAEKYFREALDVNAYHGTTLSNLGLVLLQRGKIDQGIVMVERAIQIRPHDERLQALYKQAQETRRP